MPRRLALLVATYRYQDAGLRQLTAPGHDAEALTKVLRDPQIAGFDVTTLINEPHHVVGDAIGEFYHNRRRDDLTLLYFTGHGLKDDQGRLYLAMTNTKLDRLLFTGLPAQQIDEAMESCWSRQKILVLDCCYSGAFPPGRISKADSQVRALEKFQGKGRVVLTASDSTQYSFEGNDIIGEGTRSVFTRYLVEGLTTGKADLDSDGDISLDELYSYVHDRVIEEIPQQRPKKQENVEGRIVIARNIHWSLPDQIRAAIESPFMQHRLAVVDSLAHLHRVGNDLVRAEVISQTCRLIQDDSRAVAAAAMKLMTALSPEQALRESEEQARREAEEQAPREAEEQARREAKEPRSTPAVMPIPSHGGAEEQRKSQVVTSPPMSPDPDNMTTTSEQLRPEAEANQYTKTGAVTETPIPQRDRQETEEQARYKTSKWWVLKGSPEAQRKFAMWPPQSVKVQRETEGQDATETRIDRHLGLPESWGLGRSTRRQIILTASAALVIISLLVVFVVATILSGPVGPVQPGPESPSPSVSIQSPQVPAPVTQDPAQRAQQQLDQIMQRDRQTQQQLDQIMQQQQDLINKAKVNIKK